MSETFRSAPGPARVVPSEPGGLLDVLSVAAVVLDTDGRITLWSPQAQELFGWSAEEALGNYAAKLLVAEEYVDRVLELFGKVMAGGGAWAGVFPVRRKDGSARLVEFRNMRLQDEHGGVYALGIACDEAVLRGVERDLALAVPLVAQSPLGLAVLDTDLRYVLVNPAERLVTRCVSTGRPVLVSQVTGADLAHIARDAAAADLLAHEGAHSYLAVPLTARGQVLGALGLLRTRNPLPFDHDGVTLAGELATRAAIAIDNARWYQHATDTALTLQRHLLPQPPPRSAGLQIAYRYQPAAAASGIGGDWFDAIPQPRDKTALVVGDVMGHGVHAAATMGQLRTATRTLADLGLGPARVLRHLDHITAELDGTIATCVYATWDPHRSRCRVALAGHPPPVVIRSGQAPRLLALPAGVPLGTGGLGRTDFENTVLDLLPGDRLVLYTDGLVETRDDDLDDRLDLLLRLLAEPGLPPEATCDRLLAALRHHDAADDVALVIAHVRPHPPAPSRTH
ncbi:SpoIIE family protein phosphatase [Streptomyces sp. NBC_01214]|uniref:SpoIIE family protein phosphatase n=1 Tax=Streptomyces sp. NBC_01214 TaxID=2903777 RepID=UPI002257D7AC|nr:SpoIIE family protein phosphatase [Streptomyces sp. NBC_01214]MCX4807785.1 SpoIIE family protein phosphatase [Streptomyces sp. NBC_01214]